MSRKNFKKLKKIQEKISKNSENFQKNSEKNEKNPPTNLKKLLIMRTLWVISQKSYSPFIWIFKIFWLFKLCLFLKQFWKFKFFWILQQLIKSFLNILNSLKIPIVTIMLQSSYLKILNCLTILTVSPYQKFVKKFTCMQFSCIFIKNGVLE